MKLVGVKNRNRCCIETAYRGVGFDRFGGVRCIARMLGATGVEFVSGGWAGADGIDRIIDR